MSAFGAQMHTRNRPLGLAILDQRTKEARLLRETVRDLTRHVGGCPSATQRTLIERAAWLTLHVAQLDAKATASGCMTDHSARQYLAWSNSLTRTLAQLGLKGPVERAPTLAEVIAAPAPPISTALHTSTAPAGPAGAPRKRGAPSATSTVPEMPSPPPGNRAAESQ
jgi:hypothetical protein